MSRKIWSVEELETLPVGTIPRISHVNHLEERGIERGSTRQSSLKGERAIINQTYIRTVWKATLGKFLRDRGEQIIMGFFKTTDTILNWIEPIFSSEFFSLSDQSGLSAQNTSSNAVTIMEATANQKILLTLCPSLPTLCCLQPWKPKGLLTLCYPLPCHSWFKPNLFHINS